MQPSASAPPPRTHLGITQRAPPDALASIAKRAAVPENSLATLTISCASRFLYWDVLQYAGESLSTSSQTLFIAPENSYENWDETDSSSSDSESRYFKKGGGLMDGRGPVEKLQPLIPRVFFGIGHTEFLWPPNDIKQAGADAQPQDEGEAQPQPDQVEKEKSTRIYLVHYIVGEPQYIKNSVNNYREVLLACPDGAEVLRKFPKQLVKYYFDKDEAQITEQSYPFVQYRFKLEDESWWWVCEGFQEQRPEKSVILAEGQKEALLSDVGKFMDSKRKKWYRRHGLSYRRRYLFWGPPSTGKTSSIRMMASMFRLTCCVISMRKYLISAEHLHGTLSLVPRNALLVIEDVDVLFGERADDETLMTVGEFLELLEKSFVTESVIVVMTASEIDGLDRALLRDGVDRRFFFGVPTPRQIQDLFLSFYPEAGAEKARRFADAVFERPEGHKLRYVGMLQKLFVEHCDSSADECIDGLAAFCEARFPDAIR